MIFYEILSHRPAHLAILAFLSHLPQQLYLYLHSERPQSSARVVQSRPIERFERRSELLLEAIDVSRNEAQHAGYTSAEREIKRNILHRRCKWANHDLRNSIPVRETDTGRSEHTGTDEV